LSLKGGICCIKLIQEGQKQQPLLATTTCSHRQPPAVNRQPPAVNRLQKPPATFLSRQLRFFFLLSICV